MSVGTNRFSWKPEGVRPLPWQFDTMSNRKYWFWREGMEVRPAAELIADLADVVSKNGNLLLNVPPAPDGSLHRRQEKVLAEMGRWLAVNGEAIYGTRPWTVYGEGPTEGIGPTFRERSAQTPYTAADLRFTVKGDVLYAIGLAYPADGKVTIKSLATGAAVATGEVTGVRLLGRDAPVTMVPRGRRLDGRAAGGCRAPRNRSYCGSKAASPHARRAGRLPRRREPNCRRRSCRYPSRPDDCGRAMILRRPLTLRAGGSVRESGPWKAVRVKGVELPEDKHAAGLACPLLYHDAAVRFRFRFAGGHDAVLLLRGKAGNIGRVILSAERHHAPEGQTQLAERHAGEDRGARPGKVPPRRRPVAHSDGGRQRPAACRPGR